MKPDSPDADAPEITHGHSSFWELNLAQWITVAVAVIGMSTTVGSILWIVFGFGRDIQDLKRDETNLMSRVAAVEERALSNTRVAEEAQKQAENNAAKIAGMDEHGTQASQRGIYQESDFSHATEKRVAVVEKSLSDLSVQLSTINATVARCDERLQWLTRERTITPQMGASTSRR